MDGNRFDALTKSLVAETNRRRTLGGLLGGVLGLTSLVGLEEAEAKSCVKQCQKQENRGDFCAGKNNCVASARCERSGDECFCFVTAGSSEPFCGRGTRDVSCSANSGCGAGETCVDLTACNLGFQSACAVPCPDPL